MHALNLKTVHNVFKSKEIFNSRSNKSVIYQTTKNLYHYYKYLNENSKLMYYLHNTSLIMLAKIIEYFIPSYNIYNDVRFIMMVYKSKET